MNNKFVRELLADHSQNPRNYGELPSPDVEAVMTNPQCVGPTHPEGDRVRLQVVLSDDGTTVETVRFTGDGCTLSQAGASLLSEQMIGASVSEVVEWDSEYIEEHVGMDLTSSFDSPVCGIDFDCLSAGYRGRTHQFLYLIGFGVLAL
ncbi:MAG: iron-sulfur cluster assembly scaffold protein [Halobacteriales archaeon]|nr:iron-sulfur cluster assembly scaffold protein [Halobacteriales archaeon]